ncbi:MAG: DinB family protein [Chloroflexi bacterium]|nr:DinB family protein [Chloroflexota bacterium]
MALSEVEELVAKLTETRGAFFGLLRDFNEEELGRRPASDEWCAKDILLHLSATEQHFVQQAHRIRVEDKPSIALFPVNEWNPARTAAGPPKESWREICARADAVRQQTIDFVNQLSPEDLARRCMHERWGDLTLLQFLRAIYRHERVQHGEQVQNLHTQLGKMS